MLLDLGVLVNELQQLVIVSETDSGERAANEMTLGPLFPSETRMDLRRARPGSVCSRGLGRVRFDGSGRTYSSGKVPLVCPFY